jgi:hypothetical protein
MEPEVSEQDAVQQRIRDLRVTEMAKFDIEAESKLMRMERKKARQEAADRKEAELDKQRMKERAETFRAQLRNMSDRERKRTIERMETGYVPEWADEIIREAQGFPVASKAIQKGQTADLLAELKRRGVVADDFQPLVPTLDSPEQAASSPNPWSLEENAAS